MNNKMKKMKRIMILLVVIIAFGCNSKVDYSPREIKWDRDICAKCLMGLAEKEYSVQSINQYGEVLWFDDLGCFVTYQNSDDWKRFAGDAKVQSWVGHYETGEWLDVEKSYYIFGLKTPMGIGYGALKYANDTTYDYETTAKRIKDGKTMREGFMKEHEIGK